MLALRLAATSELGTTADSETMGPNGRWRARRPPAHANRRDLQNSLDRRQASVRPCPQTGRGYQKKLAQWGCPNSTIRPPASMVPHSYRKSTLRQTQRPTRT